MSSGRSRTDASNLAGKVTASNGGKVEVTSQRANFFMSGPEEEQRRFLELMGWKPPTTIVDSSITLEAKPNEEVTLENGIVTTKEANDKPQTAPLSSSIASSSFTQFGQSGVSISTTGNVEITGQTIKASGTGSSVTVKINNCPNVITFP